MSMVTINPTAIAPVDSYCYATGTTTQALDATNDGAGAIFMAPKAGNISQLYLLITAKTGTAPTYRLGLETPTATRQPNGTILGSGTAKIDLANPATGGAWRTLDTPLPVTQGQALAATIRYQTGTVNASNFMTVCYGLQTYGNSNLPFPVVLTAGTWARNAALFPTIAAKYDDGTVVHAMAAPSGNGSNNAWNSSSNPLYRGSKWTPQYSCRLWGVMILFRPADAGDFRIRVFEGSNTTPILTSTTIDADAFWATSDTAQRTGRIPLTPTTLTAGTIYRFVIEPTTVNNNQGCVEWPMVDTNAMAAIWGELSKTTSPSVVSWSDTSTTIFPVIPIIDQIDIGGGGALAGIGTGLVGVGR